MKFLPAFAVAVPLAAAAALVDSPPTPWKERLVFGISSELRQIDVRLNQIATEMATLASPALVNSNIHVGFRTSYTSEENVHWMELALPQAVTADTLVFLPALAKDADTFVEGYGFPVRFKVEVFDDNDQPEIVLDHTGQDFPSPGCYPIVVRFEPRPIKRARLTATLPWAGEGPSALAMAEVYLLSGTRNLALEGTINSSSNHYARQSWAPDYVVDSITPLGLPEAPHAGGSPGFHSAVSTDPKEVKWLTLELPEAVALDEVRLIPVRRTDVPLWLDYGFPIFYKLEAATQPDFSDAVTLHEVTDRQIPPPRRNPVCIPGKQVVARYLRLKTAELRYRRNDFVLALAEFQVYHQGQNVAPLGRFTASDLLTGPEGADWNLAALQDGLTGQSKLLDWPDWFNQLLTHQQLSAEQAQLSAKRATLILQTETFLIQGSIITVGAITLLSLGLFWQQRNQRKLETDRMRDRLARDLHDEIGSNLGSIALICSMTAQSGSSVESMRSDLAEIESSALESANSMRELIRTIQTRDGVPESNWISVLESLTNRLLRNHQLDLALPAAPLTQAPDPETRRELYLLCKEALHNISRHAQATQVTFHLKPSPKGLQITLIDNGLGFDTEAITPGHGLGNLKARASSLNAILSIRSFPGQGTTILLDIPANRLWKPLPKPAKLKK